MRDGELNCVAQRVLEHFTQTKHGHGLTELRKSKIEAWEEQVRAPGAKVQNVAKLEKILK
jgi:hypothetical protein